VSAAWALSFLCDWPTSGIFGAAAGLTRAAPWSLPSQ